MKVGIIGLPQTGKTTLYNALTRSQAPTGLGAAADVHVGVIPVPDERFDLAVARCTPKKATPASLEITEGGARILRGERAGQADRFGADFFAAARNMEALILLVRAFESPVSPVEGGLQPLREAEQLGEELLLADLTIVENRLEKLEKARVQKRQTPAEAAEQQVMQKLRESLEALQPIRKLQLTEDEKRSIRSYAFLTAKPIILVANVNEADAAGELPQILRTLRDFAEAENLQLISLCASVEMEVAQMDPEEEKLFLEALGIPESARDRLIRAAYAALGLISFFTVGEDEVRAWTITRGTTAVGAAEKIHSDLARGFIRAEVMAFAHFREAGGCWDEARAAGHMRLEGKEYVVKDGDIMHVRFKV